MSRPIISLLSDIIDHYPEFLYVNKVATREQLIRARDDLNDLLVYAHRISLVRSRQNHQSLDQELQDALFDALKDAKERCQGIGNELELDLVAAAPDLLRVAQMVVGDFHDHTVHQAAEAAIAKAFGRESV